MSNIDRMIYDILTNEHDESGITAQLNYELFGDDEWSGVRRAEALEAMKNQIDADSYQGGA